MTEETSEVIKKLDKPSTKSRDRTIKRDKVKLLNKVVIRRLPPSMTEETFLSQIEPLPDNENYYFVPADWSLGHDTTARAYINFLDQDDIFLFKDRFDGYVFVDNKGAEYPAIVEFAPFQGMPRNKSRKKDPKANTIETDPHYISFLEELNNEDNDGTKPEFKLEYSYQIKDDKKITSTPLLQYLANKKQERRDERKRKLDEKRRQRDEDRQWKKNQITKSMPQAIKEEEPNDDGKDKLSEKRREREKLDDRKESRNRRRDQKRKEEREKNLFQKSQDNRSETKRTEKTEHKDREDDNKNQKDSKKYSQSRREKQRSREMVRKAEASKGVDHRDKEPASNSSISADRNRTNSNDEISDSVKEFIKNVASCKEFVPRNRDMPSTSKDDQNSSDNELNISEVRNKLEQLNVLERNKSIESNDSTATDKASDNRNSNLERGNFDKSGRRIRNKDRPSLEIYQPRKMRLPSSKEDGSRPSSELKDYKSNPPSDCESVKKEKDEKQGARKKVSRYSERRSGRNRERLAIEKETKKSGVEDKANDCVREKVMETAESIELKNVEDKS